VCNEAFGIALTIDDYMDVVLALDVSFNNDIRDTIIYYTFSPCTFFASCFLLKSSGYTNPRRHLYYAFMILVSLPCCCRIVDRKANNSPKVPAFVVREMVTGSHKSGAHSL
jgi:hypothetical protein